jgi:predicted GIY-YIG superfamily endonuclease
MSERRDVPWQVYILRCADGTLYTGITNDLARRLRQHRAGRASRYTRSRLPVELVHSEPARHRRAALRREAAIKALPRAQKLTLIANHRNRVGRTRRHA